MVEIGKVYFFKTLTHHYLGRVTHVTHSHATLNDASEVYETGPLIDFYAGKVKLCERVPDGWQVPLGSTCVGPWPHKLPIKAI